MEHYRDDWTVIVSDDPDFRGDHFDVLFGGTVKLGRECLRFVLFDDDRPESEDAVIRILIFPDDGMTQVFAYQPCLVETHPDTKRIVVGVFPRAEARRRPRRRPTAQP